VNSNDVVITQNLDNQATNWFTRVNSRLTLPYKIDWQLSGTYSGPSRTAQGRSLGVYGINTSLSKDVLKERNYCFQ
jgi:hypothetical protein